MVPTQTTPSGTSRAPSARFGRLPALIILWGLGVAGCFAFLYSYSNQPGADAPLVEAWPADSAITRSMERFTLLMFVHPHCPCTQASFEELSRIMARCNGKADVYCVFVRPSGVADNWEFGSLWHKAAATPHVRRRTDLDGAEARRFGATTSGHVVLWDRQGELVFTGGITGSRGHAGDNAGASAVMEWLQAGHSNCSQTFVFGCSLL